MIPPIWPWAACSPVTKGRNKMGQKIDHRYDPLFAPLKMGSLTVPNRIVLCAMGGTAPVEMGAFNEKPRKFFLNCARHGVGTIVPGLCLLTDKWGRPGWLDEAADVFRGPLKEFMKELHDTSETKLILQISAGMGRGLRANFGVTLPYFDYERAMVSSSENPNVFCPEMKCRALTRDEIHKLVDVMINSAVLAQEAGCDGVELHAVHEGYLLDQFAIKNYNHRTDEYGGSLENRMRITTEMISGIKKACGKDFPVLMRYSVASKMKGFNQSVLPGEDYEEWGRNLDESISVVRIMEEAGLDCLDADNGTFDSWHWCHPPTYLHEGCNLPEAAYIKNYCRVPVICSGKMGDPELALRAVATGQVDAVGLARPLLADNEWASKVRAGQIGDIRPCIGCHNGCFGRLTTGKNVSCALNPVTMQEDKYALLPSDGRKVMVVGGGIGGMEAARLAALRGFDVSLYEKTDRLGGAFIAAAAPDFKVEDKRLLKWYEKQLRDLSVPVHLNTEVTQELIDREAPAELIVSVGAGKKTLPIPGFDGPQVCDAKDYLLGAHEAGANVVVVGGGLTGCEVAYDLAKAGRSVSVVEILPEILNIPGLCRVNSNMLKDLLSFHNVSIYTGAATREIRPGQVAIEHEGEIKELSADTVIFSVGYRPETFAPDFPEEHLHRLGDCVKVGNLLSVIWGAYDLVTAL